MSKTIINLSLPLVVQETESILETYPHHPYQQAFSIPDLRQRLICYVLSRMPGMYTVVDDTEQKSVDAESMCSSLEGQKLRLESLIRQGIQSILNDDSEWVNHHIPAQEDPELAPSHWFG